MQKTFKLFFLALGIGLAAQEKPNELKLCGDQKLYPYYSQTRDGYTPDFYEVKKAFAEQYLPEKHQNLPDNTGILQVVFWVNCKGETGNYSSQTFGWDYQPSVLNPKITQDLLQITKSLKVWQEINPKNKVQNFHQYFIFKIKEGKIIDILPK